MFLRPQYYCAPALAPLLRRDAAAGSEVAPLRCCSTQSITCPLKVELGISFWPAGATRATGERGRRLKG
jgi:hypothetical protein